MIKTQHCHNCEATEQKLHDFRQEVSDAVEDAFGLQGGHTLHRFIIPKPDPPTILIRSVTNGRDLLRIEPDGTVTGAIEDASEAARVFVEHIRRMVAQPTQSDALRDQLLQECLVKLRDVQGTEAPKQYACNLIKRIERVLQEQSK